jgi:hypothetical protein
MSELARPEDEELVDYDDTEETFAQPTTEATNGAKADGDKKGSYVGIHSTGFRWVTILLDLIARYSTCADRQRFPLEARVATSYL